MNRQNRQSGMTLIELMTGIAVLAAVVGVAMPAYNGHEEKMRMVEVQKDFGIMELRIQQYFMKNGEYPTSLTEIGMLKEDPWGNTYQYARMSDQQGNGSVRKKTGEVPVNRDFDLYSMGPDGDSESPLTATASVDDVVRADDGGYVGWGWEYCTKTSC